MTARTNEGATKRLAKFAAKHRSHNQFAKSIGVSHVWLGKLLNGAKITYPMAKRLEKATGISWDRWVQE